MFDEKDPYGLDIDFEEEVQEFIKKKYVNNLVIIEKKPEYCSMKIETLEGENYFLHCSVSKGIEVDKQSARLEGEVFESFEQMLNKVSLEYVKKFQSELFQRLTELERIASEEEK